MAQDAKTHKCIVDNKKPDGKTAMDVGTKVYAAKANAAQAMATLKACTLVVSIELRTSGRGKCTL